MICLIVAGNSEAVEIINYTNLTNEIINKEFSLVSKIDKKPGITEDELKKKFGLSDFIEKSKWNGGKKLIYKLSGKRKMKVEILDGLIMLAIIENQDGSNYLLHK